MNTVFTIGHSTKPAEEFLAMLKAHAIEVLVDVRTIPKSRHNPQFEQENLRASLSANGIDYIHMQDLGGLRRPRKDSPNAAWRNDSFRGYADYMLTEEFKRALSELMKLAEKRRTVIMCAEAVPWRCHRSLIGDALTARGVEVLDIMTEQKATKHKLSKMAVVSGEEISYPPAQQDLAI